jgi:hypothetical protein
MVDSSFDEENDDTHRNPRKGVDSPVRKKGRLFNFSNKFSQNEDGAVVFNFSQDNSVAFSQFSQDFTDRMGQMNVKAHESMLHPEISNISYDGNSMYPYNIHPGTTISKNKAKNSARVEIETDDTHTEKEINIPAVCANVFLNTANSNEEAYVKYLNYCFGALRPPSVVWISAFRERPRYLLDFEEILVLGEGTFSTVSCARHRVDGTLYAVKRLNSAIVSASQGALLVREVAALSALVDCPYIIRYHNRCCRSSTKC